MFHVMIYLFSWKTYKTVLDTIEYKYEETNASYLDYN